MNLIRHDLGLYETDKRFPRKNTYLGIYSRAVNTESPLTEVLGTNFRWCADWESKLKKLFAGYLDAKQRQNVLDYDDLPLYWAQMMQEPEIARDVSSRFDHVLVDEYQDTNRLQASILLAMKPDGKGLWSSVMMRSPSTLFVRRRCATSWIFRSNSRRRPALSPWIATIARDNRF
jgi:DNA helicase II / ATP-dependent DNA helicase PcrA